MAKATKAPPAAINDAAKAGAETSESAGQSAIASVSDPSAATTITPSEEQTSGGGDLAASTQAPSKGATDNPDGGSIADAPVPQAGTGDAGQVMAETASPQVVPAQPPVEVKQQEKPFTLALPTVHGGKLKGIGETVWLTRETHADFARAGRVIALWPDATT